MSYCKYHPLQPAAYRCPQCGIHSCQSCSNESENGLEVRCFLCDSELAALDATRHVEPFWRRFEKAFRYPMVPQTLILLAVLSLVTVVAGYLPFSLLWYLLATGALVKYSFSCLQSTADGELEIVPEVGVAFSDGLTLLFRLMLIFFAVTFAIGLLYSTLGSGLAGLMGMLVIAALPAVVIIFAMTYSVLDAINPLKVFHLISSVGLPYGLLLAIIFIMSGSVQIINQVLGAELGIISQTLNALVGNYYTIVMFHIMGYVLFQYRSQLGYSAKQEGADDIETRDYKDWVLAKIQVMVKEGRYDTANENFLTAVKRLPDDEAVHNAYFNFLLTTCNTASEDGGRSLSAFASRYFTFLERKNLQHKLSTSYLRVLKLLPDYRPDTARQRLLLAGACRKSGHPRAAMKLLNGLHKQFPDFENLVPAYQLMAKVLGDIPGMAAQLEKCHQLIEKLEQRAPREVLRQ